MTVFLSVNETERKGGRERAYWRGRKPKTPDEALQQTMSLHYRLIDTKTQIFS